VTGEVDYLGHHVGLGKVQPIEKKVKALINFPRPTTRKQLQSFLGLADYYRKYIPHFAWLSALLSDLLRKNTKFEWTEKTEQAFVDISSRVLLVDQYLFRQIILNRLSLLSMRPILPLALL